MKNSIQNKFWGAAKSIAAVAVLGISVANLSADTLTITWTGTVGELEDAIMEDAYAHDVYLLEANKVYLQREIIELESSCHIVGAAYGDGEHPATIQPILGSDGISQFSGWPATNIKTYGEDQSYEFKNLLFNGAFDDGSTTLFGVLSTYGARNSILVDHVTSVHNEVITYFCFGQEEHWTLTNNTAVQYSSYPAGMFFGGFWWGGGSWTGTVESLLIQNNTIEGTHGQTMVIYDNGLVNRTYYERINIDHNTFVNSILETKYYRHGNNTHFTNNLFINQISGGQTRNAFNTNIAVNYDTENGHGKTATLSQGACSDSTLLADGNCWDNTNRNIHYDNNAWLDTPELLDMFAMDPWCWDLPADSNGVVVTLCDTMIAGQSKWLGDSTIAQFVNNVSESNNIHAGSDFGWNLDPAYIAAQIGRTEDWLDNGVHDTHTDRFWMHQADENNTTVQWPLPMDFSYSASSDAATHCTHGGPLGSTHHMAHTGDIALDNPDPIQGVFISEAAEGNSNNKYIEIYNGTADTVDLAGFAYPTVSNAPTEEGNHEYWNSFEAGAIIAPGGVYVIAHPSADSAGILPYANETYNYLSNGDDGFCFVQGSEDDYIIVDCVGDFYGDPGSGWDVAGVVNATKDHTLVRKFGINNGNPDWNVSAGTDAENSEWVVLEQNDWSNLGSHNESEETVVLHVLLDMSNAESVNSEGISIAGGSLFGVPGDYQMEHIGDDMYATEIEVPANNGSNYTFLNGISDWGQKENIAGQECADAGNYNDRFLEWGAEDVFVNACFGLCGDGVCADLVPPATVEVAFNIFVPDSLDAPDTLWATGSFEGWSGYGVPMFDPDGNGIYTGVTEIFEFSGDVEYKYTFGGWDIQAGAGYGGECDFNPDDNYNNYGFVVEDYDVELPVYIFGGGCAVMDGGPFAGSSWTVSWLGVGPEAGNGDWWSYNSDWNNENDSYRACYWDDSYIFHPNGDFQIDFHGDTWVEPWQDGVEPDSCRAPIAPHNNFNAAGYSFDTDSSTVTVHGVGAFLGLPKVINGAELTNPADAPSSITYHYDIMSEDTVMFYIDISSNEPTIWSYMMVREQEPTMVTFWLDAEDVPCEGSPYLAGEFNDWNATDIEMTYDEDWDEYWADVALMPGYYEYKFACYDWSGWEDVPAECGDPNDDGYINRYIEVPELEEGDWYETDVVAWGECPDPDPCDLLDCSNLQFVGVMDSDLVYEIADTLGFTADSIMSLISMGEVSMGLFSSWGGDTATYMPEFSSAEDTTFIYLAEYPDGIPDTTVYYFWWYSVPAYGIWNFEYDDLQEYGLGEECAFAYEDYDEYYDTTSVYNARYWDPSLWEEELYMLAMGDDDVDPYDVWNVDLYGSCDFWFDGGGDDMDGVYLGSFQGHDYYQVNDFVYWDEAHDIATDAGGYLATITSPEENNFLYNSIDWDVYGEFYMGLYDATMDNNGWTWVTGEPLGFQNWDEGQPDCPGCQNYGVIWEHEGKWDDGDGDMPFIVEFGDVEEPEEPVLTNYSAAVINSNSFYDGDSIGTLPDLEIHDGVHFRATFDTTGAGPYVGMAAIHYDSNFNGVLDSNDQNILNSPLVDSYYNYGNYSDDVLLLEDNGPNDYNDEPGVFETDIFAQDYGNEFLRVQGATYFFSVLDTNYSIVGITVVSPYSDSEQRYTGHALMAADTTEGVQGLYFTVENWSDENRHGISGADGYYDIGVNVGDSSGSYIHGRDWNEDDGRTMPIFWHPSPYDYYEGGGIWTWYSYYPYGIPAEGIYIKTRVLELNTMISGQVLDPDLNPVETWVEMQTEVGIDTSTFWMNYYTDSDSSGYYSGWGMNGYDVNIQSGAEGVEHYDSTLFVFTDQYDEQLDAYLFNHDIELQPIDPGPPVNLVHNGGFEDYMGWWELNPYDAGNYAFDSTGSYVYLSEETITAFEGDRVLKMWGGYHSDGYNWTDVSQAHYDYINPYDGAVITASAMMMSHPDDWIGDTSGSAAMNKAHAFISYWDWDGYYMYTDWSDPFDASFSAGDWHQIEVTATVPEGAYTVRVGVGFDQIDWSDGSVYIDDVQSTVGMTFVSTGFIEGYVNGEMYNDEFDYWYMEGIANVPVEVYSENNYYQVFTNEDGYYSVNVPANDMYYVTTPADLPGLYNSDMHSFYVYPYDYYWASFDFYSITNQWFNVQGHVTDADNNPMYDVQVELISSSTDSNGWSDYAYTDMDGYYDLEVPYGVYDFNAYAPGYLTNWVYGVEVFDYTTLDFTLEMIDEFDGAVSGVINFYGETPEGDAYVWVHTDVYQTYTYANEDGFFYVDLVNGVYDIYIGAPGYNSFYMEDAFEVSGNTATFNVDMYEYGYASAPTIVDLHDVANDQGRQLRTVWETGIAGDWEYFTQFSIWRKVDGAPIELWDYVETVPWHGDSDPYAAVVPTLGDSSMYGDYESTFMITAHTEDVNFYLDSDPVSGSSIDNLHPDVPMNFMVNQGGGGAVSLSWSASEDVDFDFYNVYRQEIVSTEPAVVFTTVDSFFVDQNAAEAGAYEYWITAVDMSGLESDPSNSVSAVLSADESLGLPTEFALRQNYPNPFNPSTQIRYALPEETRVTISIYDLMGRKVRTLVNDVQSAGYRTAMWNATNDMGRPVSAGVYIYSIHAGDFIQNRKMVLMK